MTKIDQFESVFKAAAKATYTHAPIEIGKVLVVTDLDAYSARLFGDRVRGFLSVLGDGASWNELEGEDWSTVGDLLERMESERPDLICTYRNLHSSAWRWPYSLGTHLDVLTQATTTPVVVLPRPERLAEDDERLADTSSVVALTDHLTGDDRLVHYAVAFTAPGGRLRLTHVEDSATLGRYIGVIEKLPEIDTDSAREAIAAQLLKEPRDYVAACAAELSRHGIDITVEPTVRLGHHLADHRSLIDEHDVRLVVLNTKDDEQMAMHGLAYPLAIELIDTPLLML